MVSFSCKISPRHVDRNLFREIALRHRRRDFRDIAHLPGQVGRHRVHTVGQILPGTGNARYLRLSPQPPFGADFSRHPCHLASEAVQLIDHGIYGLLQLENFTRHVHRDLL